MSVSDWKKPMTIPNEKDKPAHGSTAHHSPLTTHSSPWNITRLLDWTAQYLAQKGVESPRLDAEVLLAHCLGWSRIDLYARYDQTPSEEIRKQYKVLIGRRLEGCPVAYLVGRKEFFGLTLEVSPAVLIPRPESEYVVMECLRLAKDMPEPRVVDIGTGSGNLAVAVAHKHPGARVTAIDVSSEALAVAKRNAERHKVSNRIQFLNGDLYEPLSEPVALATGENRFDFVLSNPPYIPQEELGNLPPGVRDYEPHLALDGGPGGFTVFDRLIADAPKYLKAGGYLIVEIGSPQEKPARERLAAHGEFELGETIRDGAGHPRVLRARKR
jgi:release factor glutamine methyltransferase